MELAAIAEFPARPAPMHVPPERVFDVDIYAIEGARDDYQLAIKTIHDRGLPDLFWTPRYGGHWIVTRNAEILQVFADFEHFSSRALVVPNDAAHPVFLPPINADMPEHRAYRALLSSAFTPRAVHELTEKARVIAIELIEKLKPQGGCEFVVEFAQHLPIAVFMGIVDVPPADREQLLAWTNGMVRPAEREHVHQTLAEIFAYVGKLCEIRKRAPGADLLSRITQGKVFGRALTDQEMVGMGALVLIGGMDTVVSAMSFGANFLARSPGHRKLLIDRPDLIPNAVDELLRRFAIVNAGRIVAKAVEIDGVTLAAGDMILMPTVLGGLDERLFPDPLTVDFERPNAASDYATFGKGPHRCPGANLGRAELRVFIEEWLTRIPDFEVRSGSTVGMSSGVNGTIFDLPLVWNVD